MTSRAGGNPKRALKRLELLSKTYGIEEVADSKGRMQFKVGAAVYV